MAARSGTGRPPFRSLLGCSPVSSYPHTIWVAILDLMMDRGEGLRSPIFHPLDAHHKSCPKFAGFEEFLFDILNGPFTRRSRADSGPSSKSICISSLPFRY